MENMVYFAEEVNPVFSLVALVGRVLVRTCKKYRNSVKQPLDIKIMDAPGSSLAPCFYPQKASCNHLRLCQLITLLCADLFRDILSRYIKPADLRSKLDNNKQKLVNIFNKEQQNLIYPATGNTSLTATDFDIPIIYILLRNICNIHSHKAGWGNPPAKGDNSIAASIEIIRLTRNSILAHSTSGMIEDSVFETHWKELRNVVVQIETQLTGSDLYKRGVDFLHSCNLTSVGPEAFHNEEKSKQDGVEITYDRRSARFAEFFDELAEGVPVEKTARLKDYIQNNCKADDIASIKQAVSARDCLRLLRDAKRFTSSDVLFVQYLFKRIDCKEQFAKCYKYAEKQEALCFYEKPPAYGYRNVLFHVKGNLSDYSSERIAKIKENLAVLLNCTSEEILIGGACPSSSFLLVLSIKEAYMCKLLALQQCDKNKLTKLDIDYYIVDLTVINLEPSKEFGWNIYFDPKYFNRTKYENIHSQEEKSAMFPSQHITTVLKGTDSSTNEDSENSNSIVHIKPASIVSEGDTVHLKGMVQFHHSIRYVKWQKYWNEKFVDIDVHKPKYLGTTNVLQSPELVINDVDAEDQVEYRLEVQMTKSKEYSNVGTIKIIRSKEISKIHVYSDQENAEYYVGEDVTIKANLKNNTAVLSVSWQYATGNESYTIDSTLSKYAGTKSEIEQPQLIIRNCIESDRGIYFLLAASADNMDDVFSNKINLEVKRDRPTVTLNQVQEALYNDTVEIKAIIRSFPKHTGVIWMKGEEPIDISQPKYLGSLIYGDRPVLQINNVKKEDKDIYSIKVRNEIGEETCSNGILEVVGEKPLVILEIASQQSVTYGNTITLEATITSHPLPTYISWEKDKKKISSDGRKFVFDSSIDGGTQRVTIRCLDFDDSGKYTIIVTNELGATKKDISVKVAGNAMVFISGPVVVSSSAKIHLQTILSININNVQVEWLKTKHNITRKIDGKDDGITIKTKLRHLTFQTLEIENASGYGGEYQLSLECSQVTLKSNKINVFIDDSSKFATEEEGNCLRFFALQSVCRDAMKRVLDNVPGTFQTKWNAFLQWYNLNKGKTKITLPSSPPSSSHDLDISLMYAMFRNTVKIRPPGKGWGKIPAINNTNEGDDIERIRIHRNKISHGNCSKMETSDFNESTLDLIMAIRRLTADDEQFIKQLSDILNKVFCKGSELDQMMEKLNDFRKLAAKQENILRGSEDAEDMTIENDEKAIYFTGRKEVFIGEMATIFAFIDPKISALSKIFWQRTDKRGYIHIIDINDGKYTGSTTKFPSPTLYIHFVRKDDEGTYRLFVDAFSKVVHNSVSLVVKEGECDDTENVEASEEIGIHRVRDSNISLLHNNTIARKINGMDTNGVCFTNRPINVGEKIYLRIAETHAYWSSSMDFGLTNKDPDNISMPPTKSLANVRKKQIDVGFDILPDFNDVLCFTLNRNNTLSFSINDIEQPARNLKYVSVNNPVWLSFDLWGRTRAIEISSKKKKKKPFNSFFREYSF